MKRPELSDEIWDQNYRAPGENSLDETWERQARACSAVEKEEVRDKVYNDFLWLLKDFKGIAGGRITANLGVEGREATTLYNCFVHAPEDIKYQDPDSINGIYDMLKAQATTLKSEGGYGMNFSWIRPNGSYIAGIDSRTPGVINFMGLWDKSSEIITMGSEKVIGEKNKAEKKKIRKGAQMGVLDCVAGDTLISTIHGKIKIKKLIDTKPFVYCADRNGNVFVRRANKVWKKGKRKVIKIQFDNDNYISCTYNHKIMLDNGTYKKAKDLKFGDYLSTFNEKYLQRTEGFSNQFKKESNHKVISIIDDGYKDVYDMSVPEFHNFVANDVFVHNCWHPEIEEFIDAKQTEGRLSKFNVSVGITDGFMQAVIDDKDWDLKFPDTTCKEYEKEWFGNIQKWESKGYPTVIYKTIKAKTLWEKITKSTYNRNEPGVLFFDLSNKLNPLSYAERIATTNPCFSGDTLIAVADGRNYVPIKQLAEEGNDVPVYSVDHSTGEVSIKWGRNPRITGYEKELLRVTLDDNTHLDVTPNHKFVLMDGTKKEAKDLISGDSLPRFTKTKEPVKKGGNLYYMVHCNTLNRNKNKIFEHRLIAKFYYENEWNELYDSLKTNGFAKTGGLVVHHKDYNPLNNAPENLQIMSFKDHSKLHGSIDQSGEKNGKYIDISNEEIIEHAKNLTIEFGRKVSLTEWESFASKNNLPQYFSNFRKSKIGSVNQMLTACAIDLGFEFGDSDPRAQETCKKLLSEGYDAFIENNRTFVRKNCEICLNKIIATSYRREVSICMNCVDAGKGSSTFFDKKAEENKMLQAKTFSALKFALGRSPKRKEWEQECRKAKVPFRLKSKRSFQSYNEVIEAGNNYNHKVVSVKKLRGAHTVYNITVDNNHTVGIITNIKNTGNICFDGIYTANCGEIVMSTGICLLFSYNLVKYIKKVNGKFEFDFNLFKNAVKIGTRFADNINDISRTPLKEYDKSAKEKRRLGTGVLALGSLHYCLGIRFGSKESLQLIQNIFKAKTETELLISAELGKEKGSFELFDREKYFSSHWWKTLPISTSVKEKIEEIGEMRNSHRSANAPTGNMSIYAGVVSGGIEPVFMKEYSRWSIVPEYERKRLREAGFKFPNVFAGEWFETEYMKASKAGTDDILLGKFEGRDYQIDKNRGLTRKTDVIDWGWEFAKNNYTKEELENFEKAGVFCTTEDLSVEEHIKTLKVISPFVDQNSSKTVNVPNDYPYEDFKNLYLEAWKSGIKGITTYRAGTMTAVLESTDTNKKDKNPEDNKPENKTIKRPKILPSKTHKIKVEADNNELKNAYVTVSFDEDDNPYEVFINTPLGQDMKQLQITELTSRMSSLALRHKVPVEFVADQLDKINGQYIYSVPANLAKILRTYTKNKKVDIDQANDQSPWGGPLEKIMTPQPLKVSNKNACKQCGSINLAYEEGCFKCLDCGYSGCG